MFRRGNAPPNFINKENMKLVIKIGTSSLTHSTGKINIRFFEKFCSCLADIKNSGTDVILVSSGAIALGVGKLGFKNKPDDMPSKQAAASVGQCELMYFYDKYLSEYGQKVSQILVTEDDIKDKERCQNFTNTICKLLEFGAIPIINENDTISTSEITLGDNDSLASFVSCAVHADRLILLSDIEGLYTHDPRTDKNAELIKKVTKIDESILSVAGGAGALGKGGMKTKIAAAQMCMSHGIEMYIISSGEIENLYTAANGGDVGTRFISK